MAEFELQHLVNLLLMVFVLVLAAILLFSCISNFSSSNDEKVAKKSFSIFMANLNQMIDEAPPLDDSSYKRITLTLPDGYYIYGFHNIEVMDVELINPDKCGRSACVCLFKGKYEGLDMEDIKFVPKNNGYDLGGVLNKHKKNSKNAVICQRFLETKIPKVEFAPNYYGDYNEKTESFDTYATQRVLLVDGKNFAQSIILGVKRFLTGEGEYKAKKTELIFWGVGIKPTDKIMPNQGFQASKSANVVAGVMPEQELEDLEEAEFCNNNFVKCGDIGFSIGLTGESAAYYNKPFIYALKCKGVYCDYPAVCYYKLEFPALGQIPSEEIIKNKEYTGSCINPGNRFQFERAASTEFNGQPYDYKIVIQQPQGQGHTVSGDYSGSKVAEGTVFAPTETDKKLWCGDTFLHKEGILVLGNYRSSGDYCIYKETVEFPSGFKDYQTTKTVYLGIEGEYSYQQAYNR